ncbi:helix-turn-helix domain-containing protein [Clostridia bacterium OttesenSCG-928-O13]|nr:helix-turn-helix domain-containing protein [Clostridia bacterium OttesenSCG-928-O13]
MEFADKLIELRRKKGYSQEMLADLLGVSRQAVSKWESGRAMPDIPKLVAIADLFGVSLDELVRNAPPTEQADQQPLVVGQLVAANSVARYEYKSKTRVFGLPLVHVCFGYHRMCVAKGIIAIGNVAMGLVSIGGVALGGLALGGLSLGLLFALGGFALGGFALGGIAIGVYAVGGLAIGVWAMGGCAVAGEMAVGGFAWGKVAVGDKAVGDLAFTKGSFGGSFGEFQRLVLGVSPYTFLFFLEIAWMVLSGA